VAIRASKRVVRGFGLLSKPPSFKHLVAKWVTLETLQEGLRG
jgi:hypothetical protein